MTRAAKRKRGALLVVAMDIDPDHEQQLNEWYPRHLESRLRLPGFRTARRFRAVDGRPRYLTLYELDDADAALSNAYFSAPPDPGRAELAKHWDIRVRAVYEEIAVNPESGESHKGT